MTNEEKNMSRIALTYNPPTFKFEYTKGPGRAKYHKQVGMKKYLNDFSSRHDGISSLERSVISIAETLVEEHDELSEVSPEAMESMIEKLFLSFRPKHAAAWEGGVKGKLETCIAEPSYDHHVEDVRVNMAIERGALILSPLRVSTRNPLKTPTDLNLQSPGHNSAEHSGTNGLNVEEKSQDNCPLVPKVIKTNAGTVLSTEKERLGCYGDLNRVSEEDLSKAKSEMNNIFERCQMLPGDNGYEYDKRLEFEPDEESSWD